MINSNRVLNSPICLNLLTNHSYSAWSKNRYVTQSYTVKIKSYGFIYYSCKSLLSTLGLCTHMTEMYLNCLSICSCNNISRPHTCPTYHVLTSCNNEMNLHVQQHSQSQKGLPYCILSLEDSIKDTGKKRDQEHDQLTSTPGGFI